MKILFVCTGNTCRSCMAEVIFNELSNVKNTIAHSAGISVVPGTQTSKNTAEIIKDNFKLDISKRIACQLVPEDMVKNDLILTMTGYIAEILKDAFPEKKQKIYSLNSYINIDEDVADPFGGSIQMYQSTFYSLKKSIQSLINKLKEDSSK